MRNTSSARIARVISPAPRDVYQRVFAADPDAMPYQSPDWLDTLCRLTGFVDASLYYEMDDQKKIVLPVVRSPVMPPRFGLSASGSLRLGNGGLLSDSPLTCEDVGAISKDLWSRRFLHLTIRPNPCLAHIWECGLSAPAIRVRRFAHVIRLEGGFGQVWGNLFSKSTRNRIRKAERLGVEVEFDDSGRLMPVYFQLLEHSVRKWAEQQHEPLWLAKWRTHGRNPLKKLETIARTMHHACGVWVAWYRGEPVCASIVLQHHNANDIRNAVNYTLSSQTGANDLILSCSIQRACEAGCRYYHLGESGNSEGLASFKERFGATGYSYYEYILEQLPLTRLVNHFRQTVKRIIGFRDA